MTPTNIPVSDLWAMTQWMVTTNLEFLGVCVTIILFAGGLFYVFHFRPLQKSIEKQEEELNSIKNSTDSKIEAFGRDVGNLIVTNTNELRTLIDRTTEEINVLKNDINEKSTNLEKKTLELINKANQEVKNLENKAQLMELNTLWTEHYMWEGRQIDENSLALLIDFMEKSLEYKKTYLIDLWFDRVKKILIKIKKYSSKEDKKDEERLYAVLEKINGKDEEKKKSEIR